MRRPLGTLLSLALAALVLVGCGDDEPSATDPAPTSATPTGSPDDTDAPTKSPPLTPGGVEDELVEIVHSTAGGGTATGQAVALASPVDVEAFVAPFSDTLVDDVRWSVERAFVPEGWTLWAAVVALGCDVPPGVDVAEQGDGYLFTAQKVASPIPECFAPVTSVALVLIRD